MEMCPTWSIARSWVSPFGGWLTRPQTLLPRHPSPLFTPTPLCFAPVLFWIERGRVLAFVLRKIFSAHQQRGGGGDAAAITPLTLWFPEANPYHQGHH
ncbi:MAG: hypothetical protein IPL78_12140 [Chloroflexi bacterium]|nr:hypothetical protein [Chloroflexota bacterium]